MKTITNKSNQGFSIPFRTPEGDSSIFLAPRGTFNVPDAWESSTLDTLVSRKMIHMAAETSSLPPAKVQEYVPTLIGMRQGVRGSVANIKIGF